MQLQTNMLAWYTPQNPVEACCGACCALGGKNVLVVKAHLDPGISVAHLGVVLNNVGTTIVTTSELQAQRLGQVDL